MYLSSIIPYEYLTNYYNYFPFNVNNKASTFLRQYYNKWTVLSIQFKE